VSTVWVVSMVLAWIVIGGLCLIVAALVRQVGVLNLRLEGASVSPGMAAPPELYAEVAGHAGHPMLAVALSAGCALCAELEPALGALAARDDLSVLVVGSDRFAQARPEDLAMLAGEGTPRAVAVTAEGVVAAVGHPRSAGDLEAMAHAARHAVLSAGPGAQRAHEWGVSVPYWEGALANGSEGVLRSGQYR
jgi:hypothetical protein